MNVKVISVNPGSQTLGAQNKDLTYKIIRRNIVHSTEADKHKKALRALFALPKMTSVESSRSILILRLTFGVIMFFVGITDSAFSSFSMLSIISLVASVTLISGLLTRPIMILSGVGFLLASGLKILSGSFPALELMMTFGCMVFAMSGAGKLSLDAKLRSRIYKAMNRARLNREKNRYELSYKAYANRMFS